jgi:DNA-binding CsgD family transcriptional regulator
MYLFSSVGQEGGAPSRGRGCVGRHPHRDDLCMVNQARAAGRFRATRLRDLVPPAWLESDFYREEYLASDIFDLVSVVSPVSAFSESYFMFSRSPGQPPFTEIERDRIAYALRGLGWFHRSMALYFGVLAARAPLTGTERRVLQLVLEGAADKEVASSLGLGTHTVREHVANLYAKFGVSSRAQLLALWLGQK